MDLWSDLVWPFLCFKGSGSHIVLSSVARKALRSFKIRDPEMQGGIMITG